MDNQNTNNIVNGQNTDNNEKKAVSDITLFVKLGIIVLTVLAIVGLGIKFLPDAITVSNIGKKRDLPIYSVETDENKVALSFDAAWGNEDTQRILDILEKHNVKVTFFMTGEWVRKYPEDVKKIAAAGHDLGNHSENHKQMSKLTKEQCKEEIMKAHNRVKELTGIEMELFRPPYGDYNNMVVGVARECGYYTIQWDVDPIDGTANFVRDLGASTISVALVKEGRPVLGVIYNPYRDEMFYAEEGKGAYLNGKPIGVSDRSLESSLFCTSLSVYNKDLLNHCINIIKEVYQKCDDIRRIGSAALELAYLATGRLDLYFELRLCPWDFAAGEIIVKEA